MTLFYGFILFLFSIFLLIILFVNLSILQGIFSAAPWVPLSKKNLVNLIDSLGAEPEEVVYDLGSGDGRWLFYFARHSSAKSIKGFELSYLMFFVYCFKKLFRGYPQVTVEIKNFYKTSFSAADVVLCFLTPMAMKKLLPKLKKEMKPGAKLISYAFTLPQMEPEQISKISPKDIPIYRYRF